MVRLQFEGVRCFSTPQDVPLRPLTLLVGENSSGKTTFLALCRIARAIVEQPGRRVPFNKRPFLLGAYEQIASVRGRMGPARSFSLTVALDDEYSQSLQADFGPRSGQPFLNRLRLTSGSVSLEATTKPACKVVLRGSQGERKVPVAEQPEWLSWSVMHNPVSMQDWVRRSNFLSDREVESLESARQAVRREFAREPRAFAPTRARPRRTYDPVEPAESSEGSDVPMILANLAHSAREREWTKLRSALSDFGSKSGLFDGIDISKKGDKESDPFQISVKGSRGEFNLVDVGYGVSQVLPIVVDVLRRFASSELFLIQEPEANLHPSAQAALGSFFAAQARERRRFVIETHSDHLVDRVRMEIRNQTLKPEDVALLYFERLRDGSVIHTLELDRDGSITNPPPGYREFFLKEELSLLGA